MTVSQLELRSFQMPTTVWDSKSSITSLLEVTIFSKDEHPFIHDLSNLTWQIIFDALCASMNVGSMRSIARNVSRHAPSWHFYLHCQIEEIGSPGIICIVCHHALYHPLEHGTSSIGKQLLLKAHIAKLYRLTVRSFWIEKYISRQNSIGQTDGRRKSRKYNGKFARVIHIRHVHLTYIAWIDRRSTAIWPQRTM